MIHDRGQKRNSSWQPSHQKSEKPRLFAPRHTPIQPQIETGLNPASEIPVYSRVDRDLITAKILKAASNRGVEPTVPVQRRESKTAEKETPVELASQEVVESQVGELDVNDGVGVSGVEAIQLKCASCEPIEQKSSVAENSQADEVIQRAPELKIADDAEVSQQPIAEKSVNPEVIQRSTDDEVEADGESQPESSISIEEKSVAHEEGADDAEVTQQPIAENSVNPEVIQRSLDDEVEADGES